MRISAFPRLQVSLQILIYANEHAHERRIHHYCERERAIESMHALLPQYVLNALSGTQLVRQLHPLLYHIRWCLKEVVSNRRRSSNKHRRVHAKLIVLEL